MVPTHATPMAEAYAALEYAANGRLAPWFPLSVMALAHAVSVGLRVTAGPAKPQTAGNVMQMFAAYIVGCVGGGSTVAMILGETPAVLASDSVLLAYTAVFAAFWALSRACPRAVTLVAHDPSISLALSACGVISSTSTLCRVGVDGARRAGLGVLGTLFLGVLGGCGGSLWTKTLHLDEPQWHLSSPFTSPAVPRTILLMAVASAVYFAGMAVPQALLVLPHCLHSPAMRALTGQFAATAVLLVGIIGPRCICSLPVGSVDRPRKKSASATKPESKPASKPAKPAKSTTTVRRRTARDPTSAGSHELD